MSDVVFCPYNRNHRIVRSKLLNHMDKCNAPQEIKDRFTSCKYNYLHIIEKTIQKRHEELDCPNRPKEILREDDDGQEGLKEEAFKEWQRNENDKKQEKKKKKIKLQDQQDEQEEEQKVLQDEDYYNRSIQRRNSEGYEPITNLSYLATNQIKDKSQNTNPKQEQFYSDQSNHFQGQNQEINYNKKACTSEQAYHKNRRDKGSNVDSEEESYEENDHKYDQQCRGDNDNYGQNESAELSYLQGIKQSSRQSKRQGYRPYYNDSNSSRSSSSSSIDSHDSTEKSPKNQYQKNYNNNNNQMQDRHNKRQKIMDYPLQQSHIHKNINNPQNLGNRTVQGMYQGREQQEFHKRNQIQEVNNNNNRRQQQYQYDYFQSFGQNRNSTDNTAYLPSQHDRSNQQSQYRKINNNNNNNYANYNYENDREQDGYYRRNSNQQYGRNDNDNYDYEKEEQDEYYRNNNNNYNIQQQQYQRSYQNQYNNRSYAVSTTTIRNAEQYNKFLQNQNYINNNYQAKNQYNNNQQQYQQDFNPRNISSKRANTNAHNDLPAEGYYEDDQQIYQREQYEKYLQEQQQNKAQQAKQNDLYQSGSKYRQKFIKPHNLPESERDNIEFMQMHRNLLFENTRITNSQVRGIKRIIEEFGDDEDITHKKKRNRSAWNYKQQQQDLPTRDEDQQYSSQYSAADQSRSTGQMNRFNQRQKNNYF